MSLERLVAWFQLMFTQIVGPTPSAYRSVHRAAHASAFKLKVDRQGTARAVQSTMVAEGT
jgi:hypothetical protein